MDNQSNTNEVLIKMLDILVDIVTEQATREFSGHNWGEDTVNKLTELKKLVEPGE